ncbi:hypothetical protein [Vibrio sp. 10N]|uniref:hypothetical protein n=1 Tax=Vibrio sp. 10N TaxID=3058938 RepID=UPI002813E605|nr:hypothetical protein VB10N_41960 [Vibrio sp. 10N]
MKWCVTIPLGLVITACSAPVDKVSGVVSNELCDALRNGDVADNRAMINSEEVTMDSVYGELTNRDIDPFAKGCFGSRERANQYRKHQEKIIAEALNI